MFIKCVVAGKQDKKEIFIVAKTFEFKLQSQLKGSGLG